MTVSVGQRYVIALGIQLNCLMKLSFLMPICNSLHIVWFGIFIIDPKSKTNREKWTPSKMGITKALEYALGLRIPRRYSFGGISVWREEGIPREDNAPPTSRKLTVFSVDNYPDLCKNALAVAQAKGKMAVFISEWVLCMWTVVLQQNWKGESRGRRCAQFKGVQPEHQKKSMEGNSFIRMQRSSWCCLYLQNIAKTNHHVVIH